MSTTQIGNDRMMNNIGTSVFESVKKGKEKAKSKAKSHEKVPKEVKDAPKKKESVLTSMKYKFMKRKLLSEDKKEKKKLKEMTVDKMLAEKKKKKQKEKKKERISLSQRRRLFRVQLENAGIEKDPKFVEKVLLIATGVTNAVVTFYLLFWLIKYGLFSILFFLIAIILIWTLGTVMVYIGIRSMFLFYLDLKRYRRNTNLEMVLPDYLLLTSANIRAGMPIDQALWLAVRPRFGVLAKQIEMVAKETLVGEDLNQALKNFSNKFDSTMLKRSINILIEGMAAGGDVGDLINKISINLQEANIMKKEMAASVMTYVIFITAASIFVAPFMFGLSYQLLTIVQGIMSNIDMGQMSSSISSVSFNLNADAVTLDNFKIFAIVCLSMTAFFSCIIITTIRKGDYREGLSYIPVFILTSVGIFFMSIWALGYLFGGMF